MAALSAIDVAFLVASFDFVFLASLMATSRFAEITLFTFSFTRDPLRALLALFVTGMCRV